MRNLFNITSETDQYRNHRNSTLPAFFRTEDSAVSESPQSAAKREMDEAEEEQRHAAEQLLQEREEDQRYKDELVNELLDDGPQLSQC